MTICPRTRYQKHSGRNRNSDSGFSKSSSSRSSLVTGRAGTRIPALYNTLFCAGCQMDKKEFRSEIIDWLWVVLAVAFIALIGAGVL